MNIDYYYPWNPWAGKMPLHIGSCSEIVVKVLEFFISQQKTDFLKKEPTFQWNNWRQKWPQQNVCDFQSMGSTEYFALAGEGEDGTLQLLCFFILFFFALQSFSSSPSTAWQVVVHMFLEMLVRSYTRNHWLS